MVVILSEKELRGQVLEKTIGLHTRSELVLGQLVAWGSCVGPFPVLKNKNKQGKMQQN